MHRIGSTVWRFAAASGAILALTMTPQSLAFAQQQADPPDDQPPQPQPDDPNVIIVVADRSIVAALRDVPVEQTYDRQSIDSYGVSTVGELLGEIRSENGDADPVLLVNGQPVPDPGNISDIPVEAIARVETLPRGSAQRVNGGAGQRAYNIVLKPSVKSATATASHLWATEGGWTNDRGEVLLTYVKGQDRVGITLRGSKSGTLFEDERNFTPRPGQTPYAASGNIIPFTSPEIDPALSLLAGYPVTSLGLPQGNSAPTLADLLPGANRLNPDDSPQFRSLRGAARPIEASVSGSKGLGEGLNLQFTGRLNWNRLDSFNGLPSARFLLPATHPDSPFGQNVTLLLNDPDRPLTSRSKNASQSLSAALNITRGDWRGTVSAKWDSRQQDFVSDITGPLGSAATIGPSTNPFDGRLAGTIPLIKRRSSSNSRTVQLVGDAEGPLFDGWAGPIRARVGAGASRTDYNADDSLGDRSFDRSELLLKAGLTVPLTSKTAPGFTALGDSQLSLDIGHVSLGRFGELDRRSASFEWQPLSWLRLVASVARDERAIAPELLAAPEIVNVNVPYFDPVTGETVDVTTVFGGAAGLGNEKLRTRSIALTANPLRKWNLYIDAEYVDERISDQVGALPLPSPAVVAAFPDRFIRDLDGTLILVDSRAVNFARQDSERLKFGIRFAIPLSAGGIIKRPDGSTSRIQPLRLQVSALHSHLLNSTTLIRDGLGGIDLLAGGAIGVAGGPPRRTSNATIALTQGATGLRLSVRRRGLSYLATGTAADPDVLTFRPLTTFDLKAIADLGQYLPNSPAAKNSRVTLSIDNLLNRRQRVTDSALEVPYAYQPVRRDPIGRTIQLELRKQF